MDSATLEPMDVYLPEEVEATQDPDTESLHRAAFVDYTLYQDQQDDDFDEWCRACEEEMGDYPDREAYEAGRYIVTATGGR